MKTIGFNKQDTKNQATYSSESSVNTSRGTLNSVVQIINEKPIYKNRIKEHFQFSNNTSKDLLLKHSNKTLELLQHLENLNECCCLIDKREHNEHYDVEDIFNSLSDHETNKNENEKLDLSFN